MHPVSLATLLVLLLYLAAFFAGSTLAARAAGQSVWLFGTARGRDLVAAIGFRGSFVLAVIAPLTALVAPSSAPGLLWGAGSGWFALPGHLIAVAGAMLAFAAQMAMGASWRVGVRAGATGDLVRAGLYTLSRNPTFLGQALLLAGVFLAIPSLAGGCAVLIFLISAQIQIRSEEAALLQAHGDAFRDFAARTPRWFGRAKTGGATAQAAGQSHPS